MNFSGFAAVLSRRCCVGFTGLCLVALAFWVLPNATAQQSSAASGSGVRADATADTNSATISGTVMDTNGSEVQGAQVALTMPGTASPRTQLTTSSGGFTFAGLPAGKYSLTVSGKGWGTYQSRSILLHPGEFRLIRKIALPVTSSASVQVFSDPDEVAEEQVHIAEQQRVMGVFPNFYSSYDWNAPPMGPRQKYQLALRSIADPVTFLSAGAIAGAEQYTNSFSGYGSGVQGYFKRYAAAYANVFVGRMLSNAVFPSLFHQDPRYFYRGTGSVRSRALYAMSASIMVRGDNRHWEPAYARILGHFAAGGISNLYYPSANRGIGLTLANGAIDIGANAAGNIVREFMLKPFTTMASRRAGHQP